MRSDHNRRAARRTVRVGRHRYPGALDLVQGFDRDSNLFGESHFVARALTCARGEQSCIGVERCFVGGAPRRLARLCVLLSARASEDGHGERDRKKQ